MNKLDQAMEDHKQGNWQLADKAYNEILLEEVDNSDVMYLLATSQMSQNKLDLSLSTINKAIELNNKAPAFLQLKGSILARQGNKEEAIKALASALKENPNLYQAHILAGHLYYEKGDKKQALKHFAMAKKISPELPEAQVNLAKIELDAGEIQKAIDILRTVEQKHPEQASVKMMMGQAFIENGAYSFAENYFQKVLAMHPDYQLAGLYLGIAKLNSGDEENAQKLITAFNQQYPNTKEGVAALGLLMFKNNRFRAAIEYLNNAIGQGLAPVSWQAALVESLARLGEYEKAIGFYERIARRFDDKNAEYRLAELFELDGKTGKAKKHYKKTDQSDSKYIASLLGLTRCYLLEEKFEKAEKKVKKVLEKNAKHAEAILLFLTSLLNQEKEKAALKVLESLEYSNYNDVYKKTFRIQHGLILDKQKKYKKAMKVFNDKSKKEEERKIQKLHPLSEEELKLVKSFETHIDDDKKDPVFVIGAQSTSINQFVTWLNKSKVTVLNDRLISLGRPDLLYGQQQVSVLKDLDDDKVRLERKLYFQKARVLMTALIENSLFVDCMYLNPLQMTLVKKFFPNAKIVLLSRKEGDIKLNQKVFGKEPIEAKDWEKHKNQVIAMDLNVLEVNVDKWEEGDKDTLKQLSVVFEKELTKDKNEKVKYWRKNMFTKNHWKNYKDELRN